MVTLNVYNPSKESGRFTLSYLQSITPHFSFGTELLCEWFDNEAVVKTALAARF